MWTRLFASATTLFMLGLSVVTTVEARQENAQAVQSAPAAQAPATPQQPAGAQQANPPTGRQPQQFVNIRLEVTISISDQRGAPLAPPRVASMFLVDREPGRLRIGAAANSLARTPEGVPTVAGTGPMLNVDATPETLTNGRIRVHLGLEYRPASMDSDKGNPLHINERVSAVLEDGKPLVVSQTPDPATDRNVKVELKATIVK